MSSMQPGIVSQAQKPLFILGTIFSITGISLLLIAWFISGVSVEVFVQFLIREPFEPTFLPSFIITIIGLIETTLGVSFIFIQLRSSQRALALRHNGHQVQAKITAIDQVKHIKINGAHPYRVYAQANHPMKGEVVEMKSELLKTPPTDLQVGDVVLGFVDLNNPRKHLLDYSQVLSRKQSY